MSAALVRKLVEDWGEQAPAQILALRANDVPFDEAFLVTTGSSIDEAMDAFWRTELFWGRWVPVLTSSVTLWIAITLLMLVATKKRRDKDARLRRLWEDEGLDHPDGEAGGERPESIH